jgi:hypothetical protein
MCNEGSGGGAIHANLEAVDAGIELSSPLPPSFGV